LKNNIQDTGISHSFVRVFREVLAIFLWIFIVIKVIIFDIDVYIFEKYLPSLRWTLNYRFFVLLVIISIVLIGSSKKKLRRFFLYVISYPLILLFWRIPKLFFHNWALMVMFAPAIYDLLRSFRSRFIIMTLASVSIVSIVLSSNIYILLPSMVLLSVYLITHLYRNLRKAYRSSIFEGLSDHVKKLRQTINGGQHMFWKKEQCNPETEAYKQQCLMFYLLNSAAEIVGDKLLRVAKSRKPDLYLMISWIVTVLLTSLIYGFEYWSLYKIEPLSFTASHPLSFWSFWGLSFGKLTPSSISTILPATVAATLLSYSELFCALIILVILVFSVLTAAREKYREDIANFISEVGNLGKDIQEQLFQLYAIAITDVEIVLLSNNEQLVNQLRKVRGLPVLSASEKTALKNSEPTK
jgi:hypothetical protein